MALFLNLYLGHLLGDFVVQPGRLVLAKREGLSGLALHTALVGLCTAAVLIATIARDWPIVVLVACAHVAIEKLTILTYLRTPTRGLFTLVLDQAMHVLSIALLVWLLGDWHADASASTFGIHLSIAALASITGLMTCTLLGSIFVFESVNAVRPAGDGKGGVLRMDAARIGGMLERGAAFIIAVGWNPLGLLLPFAPRAVMALRLPADGRARQLIEAAAGLVLCAVVYTVVRGVIVLAGGGAVDFWSPTVPLSGAVGP
jgi:hypothetical protein